MRLAAAVLFVPWLVGCSGETTASAASGPGVATPGGADASVPSDLDPEGGATPNGPSTEGGMVDASDLLDGVSLPDGPIGDCAACVLDRCRAEVGQCLSNDACRTGLFCTLQTCLSGSAGSDGGLDLACALLCFNGDFTTALSAVGSISCVGQMCSAECASITAGGG